MEIGQKQKEQKYLESMVKDINKENEKTKKEKEKEEERVIKLILQSLEQVISMSTKEDLTKRKRKCKRWQQSSSVIQEAQTDKR